MRTRTGCQGRSAPAVLCDRNRGLERTSNGLEERAKRATQPVTQTHKTAGGGMSLPNERPGTPKSRWDKHIQNTPQSTVPFQCRKGIWKVYRKVNRKGQSPAAERRLFPEASRFRRRAPSSPTPTESFRHRFGITSEPSHETHSVMLPKAYLAPLSEPMRDAVSQRCRNRFAEADSIQFGSGRNPTRQRSESQPETVPEILHGKPCAKLPSW